MKTRACALAAALALAVAAAPAHAGWSSLGKMPAPQRSGAGLLFRNEQGTVRVTAVSPAVIRVRFRPGPDLGREHSYAVLDLSAQDAAAQVEIGAQRSTVSR